MPEKETITKAITEILIELTDAYGFDNSGEHLDAYGKAHEALIKLFVEATNK